MAPNPLIVALDSADRAQVIAWADALSSPGGASQGGAAEGGAAQGDASEGGASPGGAAAVGHLKVGLQAFTAHGPDLLAEVARRAPVFADLKLHDIPNTVAGAAAAAAARGVAMLTVHASGGPAMVRAAVEAAPDVAILAVTVLTSLDAVALQQVGQRAVDEQVPALARLAVEAGAAGIVCAAGEIRAVREAVGPDVLVVVPGIRPAGASPDDQARTATPAQAMAAGASHLVVGRPITRAADPVAAARAILAELA